MLRSPFSLFGPFSDRLSVVLWTKADGRSHDVVGTLGVSEEAYAEQVHGAKTLVIRDAMQYAPGADGLVTDRIGLALSVRFADCQSFIAYAPSKHVIGVLHAGWRGLALHRSEATGAGLIAGAIPEFFAALKREWNIDPKNTWVAAGPSLCQKCAGFSDPEHELPSIPSRFIDGKQVDLRGAAEAQLFTLGLPRNHFERSLDCTCCVPQTYWTYRGGDREAVKGGERNLLACVLKPVLR
ncbi:MAG: polyphenol oxidase family protein [Candidatus Peribacteraceae bacterium]|nr:polyphenol oxidase family protein [Candidatus Peribacteraceae bacterium]